MKWEKYCQPYIINWRLVWVSCKIPGISSDKHYQTPFHWRIFCEFVLNMRCQLLQTTRSPTEQSYMVGLTYWILWTHCKSIQSAAIHSTVCLEYNVQVGCHSFHFAFQVPIYSSGPPTSFRYHLSHLFHNSKLWLRKNLRQVWLDLNCAKQLAVHPMPNQLRQSGDTGTSQSTAMLPMQPAKWYPRSHIQRWFTKLEVAQIRHSQRLYVSNYIPR